MVMTVQLLATIFRLSHAQAEIPPLRFRHERGGGGRCTYDVECGWFPPGLSGTDRRNLPSGNGARCLVGRCVCASEFEDRYACDRCTLQLRKRFSYSDGQMEVTSQVRDRLDRHIDMCSLPVGGMSCRVGICERDRYNRTVSCPGDIECNVAGGGSGICVGAQEAEGVCVCAEGRFCKDCSLSRNDVLEGARCERYVTGGALCGTHSDCGHNAYCTDMLAPNESLGANAQTHPDHPYCKCDVGYSCRRCHHRLSDLELGGASCTCDDPVISPSGGAFSGHKRLEVGLSFGIWDSEDECEVRYIVQKLNVVPQHPLWDTEEEAREVLKRDGLAEIRCDDGSLVPVVLELSKDHQPRWDNEGNLVHSSEHFYIHAVSLPRPNTTWETGPSRVVRSELYVLSLAKSRGLNVAVPVALALLLVTRGSLP